MTRIRTAIIGLSWIGADPAQKASDPVLGTASPGTHASAMATVPDIEVVAGCDIDPGSREAFIERWSNVWPGLCVYDDYRDLLAKEQVDLISIVTPDHLHAPVLHAALAAGVKAIFCEKPLSTSLDEADRMVQAVRAAGVPMSVNYGKRWYPEYIEARRLVRAGAIGRLVHIAVEGGGPRAMLWRIHTHQLDLINFFAELEPAWVWAELEPGWDDYGTTYKGDGGRTASREPGVNAHIGFANGIRASFLGWKQIPQDVVVHLLGTEARIELDLEGWRIVTVPSSDDRAPTPELAKPFITPITPEFNVSGMSAALRELIVAMRTGSPRSSTGETARRTMAITDAILQSAAQGNIRVSVRPPPWAAEG